MAVIQVILLSVFTLCCVRQMQGQTIVCPSDLPDTTLMAVYNDKCYQFVSAEKYWDDARNYCWEHKGRLVKIDNWQTNSFIVGTLNALQQWQNNGVWIGLHDRIKDLHWQWVTTDSYVSESLVWDNWGASHPGAVGHTYRDCVRMVRKHDWQWHETPCHKLLWKYRFICEYEPPRQTIESSARVQSDSRSPPNSSNDQQDDDDDDGSILIPGARRSSPFTRGRQQQQQLSPSAAVSDDDSEALQGNAEFQIAGEVVSAEQRDFTSTSAYRSYLLVAGVICLCLLVAFTFIMVLLLVRLWRVRRRDRIRTIDALPKSRMWRAVNMRDTDSVYDSQHVVYPRAPWENEYFLQKGHPLPSSSSTSRDEGVFTSPLPYESWALGTDIVAAHWSVTDQPGQQKLAYDTPKQD